MNYLKFLYATGTVCYTAISVFSAITLVEMFKGLLWSQIIGSAFQIVMNVAFAGLFIWLWKNMAPELNMEEFLQDEKD